MVENSLKMGNVLKDGLASIDSKLIKEQRGRGLFRSIELHDHKDYDGNDLAIELMKLGLLTKATKKNTIRLAPSLIINE